jgi:hypothetical protein
MRTQIKQLGRAVLLVLALLLPVAHASIVNLTWDPSPDASTPGSITGYKLYYSLMDFTRPEFTNGSVISLPLGNTTNAVLTNLAGGNMYFFSVVSVGADGVESEYSNVASYVVPVDGDAPPLPDLGGGGSGGTNVVSGGGSGGSGGSTGGTGGVSSPTQSSLIGMLPRVWLYPTNGQALLAISGTVGAKFTIQSSTNPGSPGSWITVTNLKMTMAAPNANPMPGTTLEKAFIPALQSFQDPDPLSGNRFYRLYMPLGYAIVANQVLTEQGYNGRLIAVRLPGIDGHIVCYVTQEAAYLDYNDTTYMVKLEMSGPSIREVATKVATTLTQNWTSASEFTVSDAGIKSLFATVVQTDSPASDPPLGVPNVSSSIVIDF